MFQKKILGVAVFLLFLLITVSPVVYAWPPLISPRTDYEPDSTLDAFRNAIQTDESDIHQVDDHYSGFKIAELPCERFPKKYLRRDKNYDKNQEYVIWPAYRWSQKVLYTNGVHACLCFILLDKTGKEFLLGHMPYVVGRGHPQFDLMLAEIIERQQRYNRDFKLFLLGGGPAHRREKIIPELISRFKALEIETIDIPSQSRRNWVVGGVVINLPEKKIFYFYIDPDSWYQKKNAHF